MGIDIRAVVERALKEEIRRVKLRQFEEILEKALQSMDVPVDEWIRAVKESRLER